MKAPPHVPSLFPDFEPQHLGRGPVLAADSLPPFRSKRTDRNAFVSYRALPTGTALSKVQSRGQASFFEYSINPYRGCEFGCAYCYARYTHDFFELKSPFDFERQIFAKRGFAEALRADLVRWLKRNRDGLQRETLFDSGEDPVNEQPPLRVGLGSATDPYQPLERREGITRAVLGVLSEFEGFEISIATKSDLITRDLELLAQVHERHVLRIAFSLCTVRKDLARILDPKAPVPRARLEAARTFAREGFDVTVLAMPILPGINASPSDLHDLLAACRDARVSHVGAQLVFLRGTAKERFLITLRECFPHLEQAYLRQFEKHSRIEQEKRERFRRWFEGLRSQYGFGRVPEA